MQKKILAIILIISFVLINVTAFASNSDFVTITTLVSMAKPGDTITIKGQTSFELVNISISRPNGTSFYYRTVSKSEFENGIDVSFPSDITQAPIGRYTINVGSGSIFDQKTLNLTNKTMINLDKTTLYRGNTLIITGTPDFDMVHVSITRPNGTQYYYKLVTTAELTGGIPITFDTSDTLGIYTIRIGYEDQFETKTVELKTAKNGPVESGGGGGGGASPAPSPSPSPTPKPIQIEISFNDINDFLWAKESIIELAEIGAISGTSKDTFEPRKTITRAEFVKIIVGVFNIQASSITDFIDVNQNDWFYQSVQAGYSTGIIKGMAEGRFAPNNNITREQAAVILYRVAMLKKIPLPTIVDGETFQDGISDWAIEAINALFRAGIIKGKADNIFAPQDNMTRAEAAKVIYGAYQLK